MKVVQLKTDFWGSDEEAVMHFLLKKYFQLTICFVMVFAFTRPVFAMSIPIHGTVLNSTETFTGMATVHFFGDGNLTLRTNKGVTCTGDFVHKSQKKGSGTVTCEDGRLGSFEFVTAGFSGTGAGMIGNEHFDFHIGK